MVVKPGYKQTEVGIIPEDWDVLTTDSLVDSNAPICYGVVQVGIDTLGGIPVVAIKYVKEIAYAQLHRVSLSLEEPYARSRVDSGDVLISIKGTIGRVGIVPHGFHGNISRELARLRIKTKYSAEYVAQQLEFDATQKRILQSVVGTTRLEFSIAELRKFNVPIPSNSIEQSFIAEAIKDMDGLLGALDKLIAKKRDLKQAAMQQLLTGKTRLPGFSGKWTVTTLGKVATISKGTQLNGDETNSAGLYPHYNGGIAPSGFTDQFNTPANTIIISEGGNSCGYVQLVSQPFWRGGHCYAVVPQSIDNAFLLHALKGQQNAIMGLRVGSGLPNVQKPALASFELNIPSTPTEQTAIAKVLSDMDAELKALEQRREKTRLLKLGMMQELLTGRIRLVSDNSQSGQTNQTAQQTGAHNQQFTDAVILGVLAKNLGTEKYPLARVRRSKIIYLFHRHTEGNVTGYLKKAAGPYNPQIRYEGPEKIAQENSYVRTVNNGKYDGLVATNEVAKAEAYFQKWYGQTGFDWIMQFKFTKTEELELLATVDMAREDLRKAGKTVNVNTVKQVIKENKEWLPKLGKSFFSDVKINEAITKCAKLFPSAV